MTGSRRPRLPLRVAGVLALVAVLSVAPVANAGAVGIDPGDHPAVKTEQARQFPVEPTAAGTAQENATLTGTVYDPDGEPAEGARVVAVNASVNAHRLVEDPEWWTWTSVLELGELDEIGDPPLAPGIHTAEAGSGGDYSLSLPPGEYTLVAYGNESDEGEGWYVSEFRTVTLSPGEQRRASLNTTSLPSITPRLPDYRVGVGEATGEPNATVEIPVSASVQSWGLEAPANVTGGRVTLTFDPSVVQVASVDGVDGSVTDRRIDNEGGELEFVVLGADPTRDATLANVTFRITADERTVTHLILDAPTAVQTTNGTVSATEDPVRIGPDKGAITVVPGDDDAPTPVERADSDGDGEVSTPELLGAIRDWAAGEYTTDELERIIRAWARSG